MCILSLRLTFERTVSELQNLDETILRHAANEMEPPPWFVAATEGHSIVTKRIVPVTAEEFPTPARRPRYSVLSNFLCEQTFGFAMPDWITQLRSVMARP